MPDSLIPRDVPLEVTPEAYAFEACADGDPATQRRTYRIRMTGPGRIKLRWFGIRGSGAGYFDLQAPRRAELRQGDAVVITVTFDPEKVRTYRARLRFLIHYDRPDGSILSIWGRTLLTGVGKACAAPAGDEEEGAGGGAGDDDAGAGDAGPGNAGDGDGDGGDADDGDPDGGDPDDGGAPGDDAPEDTGGQTGGGSSPGSTPGAPLSPELEVCLRFWKLPGIPGDVDEAELDRWLAHTNRIWRSAGIEFTRASRPFEEVRAPGEKTDPHCLDVFVGGPREIPGTTNGKTRCTPNPSLERAMKEAGATDAFAEHARVSTEGDYVRIESGALPGGTAPTDRSQGQLLAHELGHALGIGAVPDPDAVHQEHLDPSTGEPITHPGRLMHPESTGGEGLTDLERRMARITQGYAKGGQPRYSGCERTSQHIVEPGRERAWSAELRSLPDVVRASVTTETPFEAVGSSLSVDLDLDDDGEVEWTVAYRHEPAGWRVDAPPPAEPAAPALPGAAAVREVDGPVDAEGPEHAAYGIRAEIPKFYLGVERGRVGWRVRVRPPDEEERAIPAEGLGSLDLANPELVLWLDLPETPIAATPGGLLWLGGGVWGTTTFSGGARLELRLDGRVLVTEVLPRPLPESWGLTAEIPRDVLRGSHVAWLRASCGECGSETTLPVPLIVGT